VEHSTPGATPDNVLQWLEEEQRQNKAALFRAQHMLEQAQNALWSLSERVNAIEGSLASVMGHTARLAHVEEESRQNKESLDRLNTTLQAYMQNREVEDRAWQAESDRDRQLRTELEQKVDSVARIQDNVQERTLAQEDAHRRVQQEIFQLTAQFDPLRSQDERLMSLITTLQSQVKRQEDGLDQLQREQGLLHQQDEVLQGRVYNLIDQVRRIESNPGLAELEERFARELNEQTELSRLERQRMERLIADLELGYDQSRTNIDNLQQETTQTSGRVQAFADHLEHLRQQMWDLRTELAEAFGHVAGTQEQHYRRALAELELQIRELGQWRIAPPRT